MLDAAVDQHIIGPPVIRKRFPAAPSRLEVPTRKDRESILSCLAVTQPVFASSSTDFFWKQADAAITFGAPGAAAQAPYLILHQGSRYLLGQRT